MQAELVQIKSTLKLEMEVQKESWLDMFKTAGMRRRVLVSSFLGLFTQMSGNTLLGYYSSQLFGMMGYTSAYAKSRINIANNCWNLINAVIIATFVTRFRRRWAFMTSSSSMLLVFIAMTVSFQQLQKAKDAEITNSAAQISALFWYFAYSPCYNIGNNALTYSQSCSPFLYSTLLANTMQPTLSNYSHTHREPAALVLSSSSAKPPASSPTTSTPSP